MPKIEKKLVLSKQPLALHEVERSGWAHQSINSYGAFDIQACLKIVLRRVLLADPTALAKMERIDDKDFTTSPKRARRYISKHLDTIYLRKDDEFAKANSIELYGYWFPTNIGFKELSSIFLLACKASSLNGEIRNNLKTLNHCCPVKEK